MVLARTDECRGLAGAAFAGRHNPCPYRTQFVLASRLQYGAFISNKPFTTAHRGVLAIASHDFCDPNFGWIGRFDGLGVGYIGFKFNNGSGDQYGWVRIRMEGGLNINQNFKLIDYAWGDVGDRIRAGQISSDEMVPQESNDIVPEEGSLGGLALGAAGLLAWRKRRSRKA